MGRIMGFGLCVLGAIIAALVLMNAMWNGPQRPVMAHEDPAGCATAGGSVGGAVNVFFNDNKTKPVGSQLITKGTTIHYQVAIQVPNANACDAFDVDVWLKVPGAATYGFVCNVALVTAGAAPQACPNLVAYTTQVGDKNSDKDGDTILDNWLADMSARGNLHDSPTDCVLTTAQKNANNADPGRCFRVLVSQPVAQATQTPTPTPTPTVTATPTVSPTPPTKPELKKARNLVNLWLCNIRPFSVAPGCANKGSGVEEVNIPIRLNSPIGTFEPKCPTPPDPSTCQIQTIGSFEFEVRYDAKLVSVRVEPGDLWRIDDTANPSPLRTGVDCTSLTFQGFVQFRCVTKGKPTDAPRGPGVLAVVNVRATADVYSIIIPNQFNGIVTQLINQGCQLSDLQGHHIKIDEPRSCTDAAVTIRYLEGDIHSDCVVDVLDQQQIAFRWGSRLGNLLYNQRMDLEPSQPKKGDGDIDAKDLQFIYGRHGSNCKDPHPKQNPVDPKGKPTATPTRTATPTATATATPTPTLEPPP